MFSIFSFSSRYTMRSNVLLIIINITHILISNVNCELRLIWNEEFTTDVLNEDKWLLENEQHFCSGNYISQSHCHTSNATNARLKHGVLAITAIKEDHLNKEYTSAKLNTKQSFTYGKFVIRAALPNGYLLRPAIWMFPENASTEWPKSGQIDVMTNLQTPFIGSGIHYFDGGAIYLGNNLREYKISSKQKLYDFHVYSIEWNGEHIRWFFDGVNYYSVDINRKFGQIYTEKGQPFDHNYRLFMHLGVGGIFFVNQILTKEDALKWKCSAFIIDYVRIYKWMNASERVDEIYSNLTQPIDDNNNTASNICAEIMNSINNINEEEEPNATNENHTAIMTIAGFAIVVIILILGIIFSYLISKNRKLKKLVKTNETNATNSNDKLNYYEKGEQKYYYISDYCDLNDFQRDKSIDHEITDNNYTEIDV